MAMDNHHHERVRSTESRRLKIALAVIIVFLLVEVAGGILSGSLALLGDAGHMLVDVLALTMSLLALRIARRPLTATKTYGYHRVEIIAALANGIILVLTAMIIGWEAYQRFREPPEVRTTLMIVIAVAGLAANLVSMRLLRTVSHGSINVRGAFWHIVGDTISSVGVIAAGIIIALTGWYIVDPIIAIVIGVIILWGAIRLVRESADVLLEAVPRNIKLSDVVQWIKSVPGINEVHDIHIWTITSGINALSAHLMVDDQMISRNAEIIKTINDGLADKYSITHTTLQIECHTCSSGCACDISNLLKEEEHSKTDRED